MTVLVTPRYFDGCTFLTALADLLLPGLHLIWIIVLSMYAYLQPDRLRWRFCTECLRVRFSDQSSSYLATASTAPKLYANLRVVASIWSWRASAAFVGLHRWQCHSGWRLTGCIAQSCQDWSPLMCISSTSVSDSNWSDTYRQHNGTACDRRSRPSNVSECWYLDGCTRHGNCQNMFRIALRDTQCATFTVTWSITDVDTCTSRQ